MKQYIYIDASDGDGLINNFTYDFQDNILIKKGTLRLLSFTAKFSEVSTLDNLFIESEIFKGFNTKKGGNSNISQPILFDSNVATATYVHCREQQPVYFENHFGIIKFRIIKSDMNIASLTSAKFVIEISD
ncbi:MAG: hypothetical protein GQ557_01330 [Mycoplasmataceae bacterium]|nr:hypothetical protein [Mycoplasmataceae bacterium]